MINIGRGNKAFGAGIFGNPYKVREYGLAEALRKYRTYLRVKIAFEPGFSEAMIQVLPGEDFLCPGCGVNATNCHGQILREELVVLLCTGGNRQDYFYYYVPRSAADRYVPLGDLSQLTRPLAQFMNIL